MCARGRPTERAAAARLHRFFSAMKWLNYFEMILMEGPALPKEIRYYWTNYVKGNLAQSSYLRRLASETDWYGRELVAIGQKVEDDINGKSAYPSGNGQSATMPPTASASS